MSAVDLPTPVLVTRYQCPHCRRYTRADARRVAEHMTRCWQNPELRCCKTCDHFEPEVPANRCWGDPYCNCPGQSEGCAVDAWPAGVPFPVTHCPQWSAT